MIFSFFLIKNEKDHISGDFSSGGNEESRGLENTSLYTAGSRQSCCCDEDGWAAEKSVAVPAACHESYLCTHVFMRTNHPQGSPASRGGARLLQLRVMAGFWLEQRSWRQGRGPTSPPRL